MSAEPPPVYTQPGGGQQYGMQGQPQQEYGMKGGAPPPPPGPQPQQQTQWMPAPQAGIGMSPGLAYLSQIDQLLVHQVVELMEVFTGWECRNRYEVKNSMGQQVYFAGEESDLCMRQCCGPARGFQMHIVDNTQQEVIRVNREFKCCAGCCWCANVDHCAFELAVEAPVGQVVGYVRQRQYCWVAEYDILDANREQVLRVKGPCCVCQGVCCTWDQEFVVYDKKMTTELGKISKQWGGLGREMFTNANNFSLTFPLDLDVKMKATLLGACFLIDFMFFEQKNN
ncbi:phospholipid scramblase 1-like [Glandiceps talaboti]